MNHAFVHIKLCKPLNVLHEVGILNSVFCLSFLSASFSANQFSCRGEMANILDLLSMRNMLALSAALNVSLMLKIIQEKEKTKVRLGGSSTKETTDTLGAPPSAINVSSSQEICFQNCEDDKDIEDDGEQIIHIEQ